MSGSAFRRYADGFIAVDTFFTKDHPAGMTVIGFLDSESQDGYAERLRGYSQGLKAAGYIEGEASGS